MRSVLFPPFPDLADLATPGTGEADPPVAAEAWQLTDGALGDETITGWDYLRDLEFRRVVTLDIQQIRERCQLGRDARVRLSVLWSTGAGYEIQHRGWTERLTLEQEARKRLEIVQPVAGESLASEVTLSTLLVLESRGRNAAEVAAVHPGSVLWRDGDVSLILEGRGAKMPTVFVDFKASFGAHIAKAAWSVFTTSHWLTQHPSIGIQVRINGGRPEIRQAVTTRPGTDKDRAIRSMLFFDVGRCLINRALDESGFGDDTDYPTGSAGAALLGLLSLLFPNEAIGQVRTLRTQDPETFERTLQAGHRLLGDAT